MAKDKLLCLKIDVDTHEGMKNGVPALLEDLNAFGAKATFCLSFGPDNAGKAIFKLFTDFSFLKKMFRTGAPKLYGLRTVLSGTLLPARPIATAFPELCREIEKKGHEIIVHAWDHRKWQDHLKKMTTEQIKQEFKNSFNAYKSIFGKRPRAVAAPGWQATERSLEVQDSLELLYASDFRQGQACFPRIRNKVFKTLQIPTTGPCIEELLTIGIRKEEDIINSLKAGLIETKLPVLALHAEVEGGVFRALFRRLMSELAREPYHFITLEEAAKLLLDKSELIPVCDFCEINLPGRAGKVASVKCQ